VERPFVSLLPHRISHIALALALPLGLAACGVKGPLEPPPYAAAEVENAQKATAEPAQSQPTSTTTVASTKKRAAAPARTGSGVGSGTTSGAVVNAPAARERNPLDWLVE
jgi:predicted small lipoprotein YifL